MEQGSGSSGGSFRGAASKFRVFDAHSADPCELAKLFDAISGDALFTPHPFNRTFIDWLRTHTGRDRYLVASLGTEALMGYGMLRGWDDGFEVPSLGIAIHPSARGIGLGTLMMNTLHRHAWAAGAQSIRLRVHPENARAIGLYMRLGYACTGEERGQLVMVVYRS